MNSSHLYNKAGLLDTAAHLNFDNCLYPAVAHSSYYSCFLLMSHIWVVCMNKTFTELQTKCALQQKGTHEILTVEIYNKISQSSTKHSFRDGREFNKKILQLRRLRTSADYENEDFNREKSAQSLSLMSDVKLILNKYL